MSGNDAAHKGLAGNRYSSEAARDCLEVLLSDQALNHKALSIVEVFQDLQKKSSS